MSKRAQTHPAYARMLEEAKRTGLPSRFETDLTRHDLQALKTRDHSEPFVWLLYDGGTHLFFVGRFRGSGSSHRQFFTILESLKTEFTEGAHALYWWDGTALIALSFDAAETKARDFFEAPNPDVCIYCGGHTRRGSLSIDGDGAHASCHAEAVRS